MLYNGDILVSGKVSGRHILDLKWLNTDFLQGSQGFVEF